MAVNVVTPTCESLSHRGEPAPAIAITRPGGELKGPWRARCQAHVDHLERDPDPVAYDICYLDPTRQRRPEPDHYDRTAAAVKRTFTDEFPRPNPFAP